MPKWSPRLVVTLLAMLILASCARGQPVQPVASPTVSSQNASPATPEPPLAAVQPPASPTTTRPAAEATPTAEILVRTGRLPADVDVRSQPDQAASVLGRLPEGASVIVTGATGEWLEIIYGGGRGGHGGCLRPRWPSNDRNPRQPLHRPPLLPPPPRPLLFQPSPSSLRRPPSRLRQSWAARWSFRSVAEARYYIMKADGTG